MRCIPRSENNAEGEPRIRLFIDAINLAADRRGMGRAVRSTLETLERMDVDIVFVVRRRAEAGAVANEFSHRIVTARALRAARPDAVWYPWNGMRFEPHAPAIVTVHDPFAFMFPHGSFIARRREQAPIRRAVQGAEEIFTGSQWTKDRLHAIFGLRRERVRVVPAAPAAFWHPVEPPPAPPYFLFVAGPEKRKNAQFLFGAYAGAYRPGGPRLVVAGTLASEDESALRQLRAPYERVLPSDEELRALYSGALAVLVPSLAEGAGLPVLEAMACGAPVIASDASALPETCGGAGLLASPADARAWSNAMLRVQHDDTLRAALRKRGLARVARLDRDALAKALVASVRRFAEER